MSRIADILIEQGRIKADAKRQSGQLWGNAVSQIAQVPGNIYAQRLQDRNQQQQLDRQSQMDALTVQAAGNANTAALSEAEDRKRTIAGTEAAKLQQMGYPQAETAAWIQQRTGTLWDQNEAAQLLERIKTPEGTKAVLDFMAPQQAPKPRRLMSANPAFNVLDEDTGEVVQTGVPEVPKPPAAPNVGSFEDYVIRTYGDTPTPAQIIEGRKNYNQSDDRPVDAELAGLNKTLKELQIAAATDKRDKLPELPPITQRRVQQLEDAFKKEPAVVRANTIAEGYGFVKSLSDTTENPADDQALIYAFAKAMDPESVVREGEYATVQKYSQSWIDSFKFNAQRVLSNSEFLSPIARKQIKATIRAKFEASRKSYDNARKQYTSQINRVTEQEDGDSRLLDYASGYPSESPAGAAPPPATAAPKLGQLITVKGQKVRVTKILPNGKYEGVVVP